MGITVPSRVLVWGLWCRVGCQFWDHGAGCRCKCAGEGSQHHVLAQDPSTGCAPLGAGCGYWVHGAAAGSQSGCSCSTPVRLHGTGAYWELSAGCRELDTSCLYQLRTPQHLSGAKPNPWCASARCPLHPGVSARLCFDARKCRSCNCFRKSIAGAGKRVRSASARLGSAPLPLPLPLPPVPSPAAAAAQRRRGPGAAGQRRQRTALLGGGSADARPVSTPTPTPGWVWGVFVVFFLEGGLEK